jgi:hypothetical protein
MDQLLQKLQKKPKEAEKEKDFLIQIPKKKDDDGDIQQEIQEEQEILVGDEGTIKKDAKKKLNIIDKTDIGFDREKLLRRLKRDVKKPRITKEVKKLIPEIEISQEEVSDEKKPDEKEADEKEPEKQEIQELEKEEPEKKVIKPKKILKRKKKLMPKVDKKIVAEFPVELLDIEGISMKDRFQKREKNIIKASSYYLNNREIFIDFINQLFYPYKREIEGETDEDDKEGLYTHQRLVRDYINIYSPYRGILLYHGLGSGKTCSSIAIAEGLKTQKQIVVMTPASLRKSILGVY